MSPDQGTIGNRLLETVAPGNFSRLSSDLHCKQVVVHGALFKSGEPAQNVYCPRSGADWDGSTRRPASVR
jgi:hypothetical protein